MHFMYSTLIGCGSAGIGEVDGRTVSDDVRRSQFAKRLANPTRIAAVKLASTVAW